MKSEREAGDASESEQALYIEPGSDIAIALRGLDAAYAFSTLSPRSSRVLELRYGLRGNQPHSLREAGEQIGIGRQQTHRAQRMALSKLARLRDQYRPERAFDRPHDLRVDSLFVGMKAAKRLRKEKAQGSR